MSIFLTRPVRREKRQGGHTGADQLRTILPG